jgi:hypothetical protein
MVFKPPHFENNYIIYYAHGLQKFNLYASVCGAIGSNDEARDLLRIDNLIGENEVPWSQRWDLFATQLCALERVIEPSTSQTKMRNCLTCNEWKRCAEITLPAPRSSPREVKFAHSLRPDPDIACSQTSPKPFRRHPDPFCQLNLFLIRGVIFLKNI